MLPPTHVCTACRAEQVSGEAEIQQYRVGYRVGYRVPVKHELQHSSSTAAVHRAVSYRFVPPLPQRFFCSFLFYFYFFTKTSNVRESRAAAAAAVLAAITALTAVVEEEETLGERGANGKTIGAVRWCLRSSCCGWTAVWSLAR